MLAGALALILVVGLSTAAWAYFTGRFGIGPLSAADEEAITTIADGVEGPEWASADAKECAAEDLVEEHRSGELESRGIIEEEGDGWKYTGEWPADDATAYVEQVLECSDDWAATLGETWGLDDTACLSDVGAGTMAPYFVSESYTVTGSGTEEVDSGREDAVAALDECYAGDPPLPTAEPKPGYRSVAFDFQLPDTGSTDVTYRVGEAGDLQPLSGSSHRIRTDAGGEQACVTIEAEATYPWGTTATAQDEACGEAKPRKLWWVKQPQCAQDGVAGCQTWTLKYEGYPSFEELPATFSENGGNCNSVSGQCSFDITTSITGRGEIVNWTFPGGYDARFEAKFGPLTAELPG